MSAIGRPARPDNLLLLDVIAAAFAAGKIVLVEAIDCYGGWLAASDHTQYVADLADYLDALPAGVFTP